MNHTSSVLRPPCSASPNCLSPAYQRLFENRLHYQRHLVLLQQSIYPTLTRAESPIVYTAVLASLSLLLSIQQHTLAISNIVLACCSSKYHVPHSLLFHHPHDKSPKNCPHPEAIVEDTKWRSKEDTYGGCRWLRVGS